jgi:cullin-associated NEDD8-dissociated protein 1
MGGKDAVILNPVVSSQPEPVQRTGVATLSPKANILRDYMDNMTQFVSDSPMAEIWGEQLRTAVSNTDRIKAALEGVEPETDFAANTNENSLGQQLNMVSRMIKANTETFHDERNAFYVKLGKFDVHNEALMGMENGLNQVDAALASFEAEMKAQGLWDSVTIVHASEFGRSLTSNGGGSDHAWGGNYFVAGGAIKGGRILGEYPDDLRHGSGSQILKRGRVIPTTSWEQIWNGVSEWFGVDESRMDDVLPLRNNFPGLYTKADMFDSEVES